MSSDEVAAPISSSSYSSSSGSSSRSSNSSYSSSKSSIDDINESDVEPPKKRIPTYGDRCEAYWKAYVNPYVWTSMPVIVVIGILFWCLGFIPNYEKCMLSQSIFAIIGGVLLGAIPAVQKFYHHPKVYPGVAFSKQQFMRLAVLLYGFRVKLEDIAEVGWGGAISAILMVIVSFLLCTLLGFLLKVPGGLTGIIGCGFSICGIAAILSAASLYNAESSQISLACVFVIVGGFLDIIIYPSLYSIKEKLGFTEKSFGVTAGISIKEIAHTVSVGLSCSPEVSKYAMIVKMFKVLLMPFLLIALGFILPLIQKCQEKKRGIQQEKMSTYEKCTAFWGKVSIPYFAFLFILMTIINSYTNISQKAHDILNEIIIVSLSASMFCVGLTTDLRELARGTTWRVFLLGIIMYLWVFGFSWFLDHFLQNI
ncbi:hypothetical protein TRFO_37583 [Tritrichomonas foetus]|uniref:Sulfate exporter family transporter n=1 Tax=Tritrichomonas foetus TaxID=1144522 RepID=A0A1J4JD98_9EUKA|nr:hypothetical protein TRFO_37583 [Tritrichomonas foetus]|eukprot:OHS96255.1 hypothetical protein TRFO_37583 [Tritrichomonas foetus]